ncbi:unnamed protein product [Discosporangium mesarthrocarpum]
MFHNSLLRPLPPSPQPTHGGRTKYLSSIDRHSSVNLMKKSPVPADGGQGRHDVKGAPFSTCPRSAEACQCGQCPQCGFTYVPEKVTTAYATPRMGHGEVWRTSSAFTVTGNQATTHDVCKCAHCVHGTYQAEVYVPGTRYQRHHECPVNYGWGGQADIEGSSEEDEDEDEEGGGGGLGASEVEEEELPTETVQWHPPRRHTKSDWENLLGLVDRELKAHNSAAAEAAAGRNVSNEVEHAPSKLWESQCLWYEKPALKRPQPSRPNEGGLYNNFGEISVEAPARRSVPVPSRTPSPVPALVQPASPPSGPVRIQASGRRGPRGQSRYKGVCITRAGKWRAVIYIGRKQKYLGVFDSEYDAAKAYDVAAVQHFADGAKLNFTRGDQPDHKQQAPSDKVTTEVPAYGGVSGGNAGRNKRSFDHAMEGQTNAAQQANNRVRR